jgi:hypothetical protein
MKYSKPNLEHEWMEALRYREFEKMGKEGWIDVASNNYTVISYSKIKDILGNVDLDFDSLEDEKKERFEHAFEKGEVEIPIAVKFNDNDYDLLGGNTRLAGLISKGIDPKIYVVDLSKKDEIEESEVLKGGKADSKSLEDIAKKHDKKGYYHVDDMVKSLKKQVEMGLPIEMDHTDNKDEALEIVKDHLWDNPNYYSKLKKADVDEMDAGSSGSYEGPMFTTIKKSDLQENGILSTGGFDVPAFGKTTRGGRKNPLKVDGPDSIYKGRAVKDKKFPRYGGPDAIFVKINEKCKKFPYCNQGDPNNIEFLKEDEEFMNAIKEASKLYNLPYEDVEKVVLNEINKIFI